MSSAVTRRRALRSLAVTSTAALCLGVLAPPAQAASVTSATFTGGAGTVRVGETLFARQGAALTLTVATSADTRCVDVAGAVTAHLESDTGRATWTHTVTAPAGNGVQAVTVAASDMNKQGKCTGQSLTTSVGYTLDNTGPVLTSAVSPTPNAAGWSNSDVTVRWTATDAGSGVAGAQPFRSDSVSANGITAVTAPAQSDRLGNAGLPGSVTVRVDKAKPSITPVQTKNADGTTTIAFTCDDSSSGGGESSGIAACVVDGLTSNTTTVRPGVTVTATATDRAGNTSTATSTAPAADRTAPLLSGTPATAPNASGWYAGDVTVRWTASDPESGVPTAPADTVIKGEGSALTSSQTVTNGAGLSTTATSAAVRIDRTAPSTGISGTSNAWVGGSVTVALSASDNLSGVASTTYAVDGGPVQTGESITISADGDHVVTYASTDRAGNVEPTLTAHVKIDKTAPTIRHAYAPLTYRDGAWTNRDVTVTFTCEDAGGSGLASCTPPVTRSAEGTSPLVGTATDGAGNSSTDTATVQIDTTAPAVTATVGGTKNAAGWYREGVVVGFSATDILSGVVRTSAGTTLGEGRGQSVTGTAVDAAGNTGTTSVGDIDVDTTAPVLTGRFASGWHSGDVTVAWTCSDALSGPAAQPADSVVMGEGSNLSATATCADVAGNTVTRTVTGIQIDRAAPTTTASVPEPNAAGWYGAAVEVTLTGSDALSGVAATSYSVDGGAAQRYTGAFAYGTQGTHTFTFWSEDVAGNREVAGASITLKIDTTAPVTEVISPISPDSGWFVTSGIPFAFRATDSGAGVAATRYTVDGGTVQTYGEEFTADLSTGRHTVTYWSEDLAGNVEATHVLELAVDTVAPSITGTQSPAANAAGWNNADVDVRFMCIDADSGIAGVAGCAGSTRLVDDGAGQQVTGDAVDVAGNRSTLTYGPVKVDKTPPTLKGVPADANGANWYRNDVLVTWVGDDALSGLDTASLPAPSTVTGEGRNLGAGPVTVMDKAGNTSEPASVSGINIDRKAPIITGGATTKPNAAGWYQGEVVVNFECTDLLSGPALCPTSKLVKGDGAEQQVTSDAATDLAGNTAAGLTVGGISIDGTAPTTSSNNQCTATNGYCTGRTADVVLTAADQPGLSGVQEIHYVVTGGTEQVVAGARTTVSVPLDGAGAGAVRYWAVDVAGNAETSNSVALKWDNIAPTVEHTLSPRPNADEWNNSDVTVTFTAKDDDKGSGVASVTKPVTISAETAGQTVTGRAMDTAGNPGEDSVTVKLDKTRPLITGAVTKGTKTGSGWYAGPVTVTFACSDTLSGVATCPDPVTLTANGLNSAQGTATDRAGNTATVTLDGIQIDQEKPTLTTADVNVQGNAYILGAVPAATCTATDSFSGLASCTVAVAGGTPSGVGTFTYTATATDRAGNVSTATGSYTVRYRFDGFLQPINDTAHQVGASTSVFKAGSTVPAKLVLKRADGTVVQSATAPAWFAPVKGSAMSAPVDESVYAASADSGASYRYDSGQYIYNWKTGAGGSYWRIGVMLDDGTTHYVNIGLR